jgi:hypothetical protein
MGAENMFRKVFGRKNAGVPIAHSHQPPMQALAGMGGDAALHPALMAEWQRLDLLRSGLGRKAIHYVATGERGDLFEQLLALSTAIYDDWKAYEQAEPRKHALQRATDAAVISGEIVPGPMLLRTLELRIAAERKQTSWSYSPRPQPTPLTALSEMLNSGLR